MISWQELTLICEENRKLLRNEEPIFVMNCEFHDAHIINHGIVESQIDDLVIRQRFKNHIIDHQKKKEELKTLEPKMLEAKDGS